MFIHIYVYKLYKYKSHPLMCFAKIDNEKKRNYSLTIDISLSYIYKHIHIYISIYSFNRAQSIGRWGIIPNETIKIFGSTLGK